ncbi:hypothetical protein B0H63DRAFT_535507 [Podospora didyma]|uniref:Polyketide synthase n=1 Tax=Podospora didyma TaxID=330526 RepID=A0AAE0JZZ7_9PEZI|nr:hypothetical protein B0H63DRAFT_535507 [Podospora didyma]
MATPNASGTAAGGSALLLFGSQALSFDDAAFKKLRSSFWNTSNQEWVTEAVGSLPAVWADFVKAFPKYGAVVGDQIALAHLIECFQTGEIPPAETTTEKTRQLPNIVLSPLVVISQLVEYLRYLDTAESTDKPRGALGFCTGMLSAFAVASSKDTAELRENGTKAIRLAMIIGGMVDAQEVLDPSGNARALATAWGSAQVEAKLDGILERFPDSYVSVSYDEKRATVTTAASTSSQLQSELQAAGITAHEIGLYGRFHHAWFSDDIDAVIEYCDAHPSLLKLADASSLVLPTWSNSTPPTLTSGSLHAYAIKGLLVERSNWHKTFQTAYTSLAGAGLVSVVSFGPEKNIPPSELRKIGSRVTYMTDIPIQPSAGGAVDDGRPVPRKDDDIAVVGMSIKVAGADDTDEFWSKLCSGTSQHTEVPANRVSFEDVWREKDTSRKWYGNFIKDHDAFDHRFFKKSALEMSSTDPQHRQMLQAAYQAVEQSGYFDNAAPKRKKIGCYIGICNGDYENIMACYRPNAFTAVGNLKAFIAGKISHWFGWEGPSLAIDSACSSSLVAIHYACRAVLNGECTAALAGGANMMNDSLWFENLAGGQFLSKTGQCKPFDAKADGYCRGEGFAAVYLKKMSQAIADGDQILGTIAATGVLQNQNCTPVFVPNSPSLSDLFRDVLDQAKLTPNQVTVAEAHGTGTQVGDPAEYAGLVEVLGGKQRTSPVALGSAKGAFGHTESASGAVSLLKTILMIQNKTIPPQASFESLNPAIHTTPHDNVEIATKAKPWVVPNGQLYAALINNYGASGSNASLAVTEAPKIPRNELAVSEGTGNSNVEFPIRIFGNEERALKAYASRLRQFLTSSSGATNKAAQSIANLAFNLSRQGNPTLDKSLVLGAKTIDQLVQKLGSFELGDSGSGLTVLSASKKPPRPVILCFGGQVSTFVGLDRDVYNGAKILRTHLNACDAVCRSLSSDVGSIFPAIFQRTPITDPVKLQTVLFSMQYASAKSWIDSGIQPAALVGHSFGELVALSVSGILSLQDALKMVAGRATVIRESWGSEKGSMMAVEGDLEVVNKLLVEAGGKATIACFNGPRSFTLAGTSAEIDEVVETLTKPAFSGMRAKRLNVTNAFHSTLVEALIPQLVGVGKTLTFRQATIPLERSTEVHATETELSAQYVADHMRQPVYFSQAVGRLARQYPQAIFLEAGSNSTITVMASRALGMPKESHFQALNITGDNSNGLQGLASATLTLWKEGLRTTFWPHHRTQTYEYVPVLLPPYQFEKSRHWLDMKPPPKTTITVTEAAPTNVQPETPLGLFSFLEFKGKGTGAPRFRVNTSIEKYKTMVAGHIIARTAALCPATLIIDIAIEALLSVWTPPATWQPQVHQVINMVPICIDDSRSLFLEFEVADNDNSVWDWKMVSNGPKGADVLHVTGQLVFVSTDDARAQAEFKRYERLTGYHQRCVEVLNTPNPDDIIHGARNIYRAFTEVVDYAEPYRGLQRLVGTEGKLSAGRVVKKFSGETWLDTLLSDCFAQVGGIWVNCMTDCSPEDMFIATGIERWVRSSEMATRAYDARPETWDVLARHEKVSDKSYLTDIFVFDPSNGNLTEVVLGINYHRVSKASMGKTLARLTPGLSVSAPAAAPTAKPSSAEVPMEAPVTAPKKTLEAPAPKKEAPKKEPKKATPSVDVEGEIRVIIAEISGLEPEEITMDSGLAELGIDSLMGMELGREMEAVFKTPLMSDELAAVTTFLELVTHVAGVLGVSGAEEASEDEDETASSAYSTSTPETRSSTPPAVDAQELEKPTPVPRGDDFKPTGDLKLTPEIIFEAFEETKRLTDDMIAEYHLEGYMDNVLPRQTQLCVALTVEAFAQLGCNLREAKAGDVLQRIPHEREHTRLTDCLYRLLEQEARLVDVSPTGVITRTFVAVPSKSSAILLAELLEQFPNHTVDNRLTYFAGSRLAEVLRGDLDGIKLIFGTDEGRELVTALYGDLLLNKYSNAQMQEMLRRLISKIPRWDGPLKIMELGAGTGGTTKGMVPLLASLGVPIEYTFTDLSGSMVAGARKRFGKQYPFMKFKLHDIEQPPSDDLLGTQHIVIAHNAVHATRSLVNSVTNIRKALRPDGFLMILEMTQPIYWVDLIFGLFEGWWLFEDGRTHAISHQTRWQADLQSSGYGRVDWTDGWRPEIEFERVIVAQASVHEGFSIEPTPMKFVPPPPPPAEAKLTDAQLGVQLDEFVRKYTQGFNIPIINTEATTNVLKSTAICGETDGVCVAVTGATGSLGSHLIAHLSSLSVVKTVFCLNRRSNTAGPTERQNAAFTTRGIQISAEASSKIKVMAVESSRPRLGLDEATYKHLVANITHIVHNAWPMTEKRPVTGFEERFKVLRTLIDLSGDIALYRSTVSKQAAVPFKVTFQFVSSIGVMGHHSLLPGNGRFAPEERASIDQLLPNGYSRAKWVCERMLDETLHRYPSLFRTTSVRPGQIAGNSASGYWNEQEHLSFLLKSSRTLRALPGLQGDMCWTPVDVVAATMADLLLLDPHTQMYPVYHIDNPVRQPWSSVLPVLAAELDVPTENILPFKEWVRRVRTFTGSVEDNPAARLIDFLDDNFIRMSCGGMLLETKRACEHSPSLKNQGPVSDETIKKYLGWWKQKGFLP